MEEFPGTISTLPLPASSGPAGLMPKARCEPTSVLDHRGLAGRQRMRRSRAVICGLARDVAGALASTIRAVEELGQMFADYRVIIFENDSRDGTNELLTAWSGDNPRVRILSELLRHPINRPVRCLQRAARMASYRNRYLAELDRAFADFDYAIVVDTDLGGDWNTNGLATSFSYPDWDFVGAYGILQIRMGRQRVPVHYDAWAYRAAGNFTPLSTKEVNQMLLEVRNDLHPVSSCFGGLGIYRMPVLLSGYYSGEDCEHVTLHRRLHAAGYDRMFLNSAQTTNYGEKTASAWRRFRGAIDHVCRQPATAAA